MGISSHASLVVGLILALVTAAAFNWSWVAQHSITSRLPPLTIRHPWRSLGLLFRNRRWRFAFIVGVAGWALYILALRLAPLSLVQAVSAGGLALLAVLAQRAEGMPLPRREWVGVWLAVVGLVFLSVSLAGGGNESKPGAWTAVTAWFLVSFVGVGIAIGPAARHLAPGAGFGLAAGLMYAAADVGTKAAVHGGWLLAFGAPIYGCHLLAFILIQLSFQRGRALATAGLSSFCTNALPIVGGRHDLPRVDPARLPRSDALRGVRLRRRRRGRRRARRGCGHGRRRREAGSGRAAAHGRPGCLARH